MFKIAETTVAQDDISTDDSTAMVWKKLDKNFMAQKPFLEATVNKWNEHTQVNQIKTAKRSAFNATIVQQVN